jgi:hypothetical protein
MAMELTIALALSILSSVIAVSNFVLSRKDKAVNDAKETNVGLIEYQLKELKEDVKTILSKMEKSDIGTQDKIDKAIETHIKLYHNGG